MSYVKEINEKDFQRVLLNHLEATDLQMFTQNICALFENYFLKKINDQLNLKIKNNDSKPFTMKDVISLAPITEEEIILELKSLWGRFAIEAETKSKIIH